MTKKSTSKHFLLKKIIKIGVIAALILVSFIIIWVSTLKLPNINNFEERRVAQSTKILDRTGEIVLFDVHGDYKRTIVPLGEISDYIQWATIAIEDQNFYKHHGIQFTAILRAIIKNLIDGDLFGGEGGSTITQQVIKNSLLTTEKKISRKLKEWVLAPRLERILTKDQILEIYLNEVPYGGNIYGVEEASLRFFGKQAKDITLAEAAFLAALPQAPTFFSPYGNNLDKLEIRKNYVLNQMESLKMINEEEKITAQNEGVRFQKQKEFSIKAPHFVMYVLEQLKKEFSEDFIEEGGLRVITSLDWDLQESAEEIVKRYIIGDSEIVGAADKFNAENGAIVATDPNSGDILVMVGSRDYFDKEINGNFNITTAERQPGSSFKPFVYSEAFNKGYKPRTVVFDLETEFSTTCADGGSCYSPVNYDGIFRGPMTLREALAQSINIPAIKVLYLAGLQDSLNLAKKMGIKTLTNIKQYGLTLVLGGGEVRPIDMASAYGIFAAEGNKYPQRTILKIEDSSGKIIFEAEKPQPERVLTKNTARMISDILSDNDARIPTFGSNSPLFFPGKDVAAKTGTTNDYRDAWILGYTPNISVAAWAGNNDNSPIDKKNGGFVVSPMWHAFMEVVLEKMEHGSFNSYEDDNIDVKPIINGFWKGEKTQIIEIDDSKEIVVTGGGQGIHSILYWVSKDDPLGPPPTNPNQDGQYGLWEKAVRNWVNKQKISDKVKITNINDLQKTKVTITNPVPNDSYFKNGHLVIIVKMSDDRAIKKGVVFLNDKVIGDIDLSQRSFTFIPEELNTPTGENSLKVLITDTNGNEFSDKININII